MEHETHDNNKYNANNHYKIYHNFSILSCFSKMSHDAIL